MNTYVLKYGKAGLSLLFSQLPHNSSNFDYLDPLTTIIKLGLIRHKSFGTKIGIHKHMVTIQMPGVLQSVQRYFNRDDRNQLYQLRWPLIYFHGLVLKGDHQPFFTHLEKCTLTGLSRLKATYDQRDAVGNIITNCLDNYIEILSGHCPAEEFQTYQNGIITPEIVTIYEEFLSKWTADDFNIIEQLLHTIDSKTDKKTQEALCQTVDTYLNAKNLEFATIRPI